MTRRKIWLSGLLLPQPQIDKAAAGIGPISDVVCRRQHIFFIGIHNGEQSLYWRRADGTGEADLLADPARAPEHWLTKMQNITFITLRGADYDIWRYSLQDKKATPLVQIAGSSQHSSRVSPDERWLAYVSDETRRFEVYVQPISQTGAEISDHQGRRRTSRLVAGRCNNCISTAVTGYLRLLSKRILRSWHPPR